MQTFKVFTIFRTLNTEPDALSVDVSLNDMLNWYDKQIFYYICDTYNLGRVECG